MNVQHLLVGIGAIAIGVLVWYRFAPDAPPPQPEAQPVSYGPAPDYFVNGMKVTTMAPDGRPARTLRAQRMQYFSDKETTELSEPRLTVYQDEEPPWLVAAENGWISADGAMVLLRGDVEITRKASATTRAMRLQTRNLRIEPSKDYAETDEPVTVVSGEDRVEAIGMQAWLRKPPRLKLLNKARGRYVPR